MMARLHAARLHAPRLPSRVSCAAGLAASAIGLHLAVSGNLLTWLGDPYVAEGGSAILKVHPASYLAAAAAAARVARNGRPLHEAWLIGWREPLLAGFLACVAFCVLYAALMTGCCTLVVFFDTFLPAGLLAVALHDSSAQERRLLLRLLQVALGLNAALALVEIVTHSNWVPLYLNGGEYEAIASEFRPTSLCDHPLTGAIVTMIGLLLPFDGAGPRLPRIFHRLLLSAGLVAFGGRIAAGLTLIVVLLRWSPAAARRMFESRTVPSSLLAGIALALAVLAGLLLVADSIGLNATGLNATGLGGRLIAHLYWDDSAQVRLRQWHILDLLNATQLVFGSARPDLIALLVPMQLQWGVGVIENFWLLMFITLGIAGFPVFVAGLAALLVWCARQSRDAAPYLAGATILAASTSNSLGRKSDILVVLVAAAVAAGHPAARRLAAAAVAPDRCAAQDRPPADLPASSLCPVP